MKRWARARGLVGTELVDEGDAGARGRGLFAAEDLRPGDELFAPLRATVSPHAAIPAALARAVARRLGSDADARATLAAFLCSRPRELQPWLAALPTPAELAAAMPMFWPEEALDALEGSFLRSESQMWAGGVRSEYERLFPGLADECGHLFEAVPVPGPDDYAWAVALVRSRAFSAPEAEGDPDGVYLVPFFDLLNHAADPADAHVVVQHRPGSGVAFVLARPAARGEELLVSYGALSNRALLSSYGFVLPRETRFDEVEVSVSLSPASPHYDASADLLAAVGRAPGGVFPIGMEPPPLELHALLYVMVSHAESHAHVAAVLRGDEGMRPQVEVAALRMLLDALYAIASRYTTPLEDDADLVELLESPLNAADAAVVVRCGEKRVLAYHMRGLEARIAALSEGGKAPRSPVRPAGSPAAGSGSPPRRPGRKHRPSPSAKSPPGGRLPSLSPLSGGSGGSGGSPLSAASQGKG